MGWFDNIFNSEKKREQERKRAEFEAKQAEVIARCYRSEEELAQLNLLIHDQDDMQKFEDWVEEKRENLPYNTYPIAVLQSLRDDIKAEDVPFLKDRERLVLEGILKRLNSENLIISDLKEIGKILNSKTVYDQQLFPLIKKHYDITNLPNEEYRYRYLEAAGYTKEEARQSFSIYSRGLISAYNSPKTLEAFPNAKTQIENYLINTADDPYSSYALRGEVRRIIADCPELQNNQTAQLCEQKFAQHDKDISQHTVKIYDLYELDAYIKLLSLNSISPEFKEDIHLSINAAVANLFAKNPDQPFHNVLYTLNSYAENYPEHFLALPVPLLHDYVNQADKRDISFYHIENGENVGDYQKPDGTFVNTYYSSDVSYHTLRLLLDKGYGSEEARAARLERIAKIDEAYPTAIDYYKEKYGQYIGHEQRQTAEEKQETLDNVPSPTVLHDEFVGNYLRKEALNNENGEIIGTRFYLAEDGSEYVELIGDENNPKQKITFIEADSHMLFSKEEYDFEAKTTTSVRYDNGKPLYVEIKNDQNVQIQTEHYKNGNLWERYRSTDDKNSAYGPNHIFEAYTEEGVLESVARFDDKNAVADVTYYESDGKTVSKVEYKNENGKPARIELYSEGKLADVTVFDEEGNPHSESQEKENVLPPDVSEQNLDDKANEAAIDPAQAVSETIENQSENEETQPMESPIEIQTETADEKQENTEMPETSANEGLGERNQGIAAILGGLAENARIQEELEAQSRPAPAEPVDTQPQTETSETTPVENNVTFVPYSMEEREAYIKDGLEQYEQKLDQNGFPKKGRKTKLESQKRNLTQVYAFDYVDEKLEAYEEISTPDLVNVLEDLTIQDSNEQLDDEDLRETIHDLISESQYRIKDFLENEDKSQYSAAELKALMMLSSFNAKLYKGRIEEQNKAKFASFTQAENVLAEELNKKPADGETLNNNASHETANNADKEAVVNPVSQDNAEEEVDDAANAAAEKEQAEKEEQEKQRQQEAEKARKEQERKEAEEGQPTTKEEDTPSPYQKWKEKLEAVKEKGDIHALLAFANEALQHKNDFKDYKHKGAKNEKINAFAWLSDNIDKKTLPKHSIEWLTPSDIEIFKNLAQARIDEFRFTSGRRQSLIGVRTKQEKNVFVDLLLKEGKDFIENKNDIIKTAENKEQQKDLLKKLEKWKELYSTKFYKDVYVIDENNKIEDLLKLLDEEIAKLQQTLENTNQNPNDNGNSNGIVPDDNGNEEPVVEINVGGEDLNPDNSGGDDEGTGDDNGDDGNDDTPDDVEPIIELDDFDELVVNHATEPDLIPSTETLANLIEQKCTEKDIANTRENDNFTLFADEADKDKPEKANGKISVIGNNNVDIISSEFKVYKAAVEAAKEKGAKKIAITSKNADGSLRDLSDSTEGEKNKKALAHLFLACAQSGLEAQTTPEIEAAVQTYPEYQTYKLTKAKNEAYAELSLKISSLSDDQKNEYQRLKNEFKTASDDTGKRAAQADLLRFETTNGIGALKQKVKDTTLAQYNYYIENGQHFGEPTDDAAKAARKTQIKEAYDRYQNRGDHYQNADDNSEVKGTKALEIAMYKRLINETTI